ncbi:MAG: hypothetical protein HY565_05550 [Candidatus Kerfeldbacteria bacterium]|nr:hypothetical protein [Candidatus Kerfeldbacteria bacterium]
MLINLIHSTWLVTFVLTVTIETGVLVLVIRERPWFVALIVLLLNLFTQPLATVVVTIWPTWFYLIELVVWLVEGIGLALLLEMSYRKGWLLALLANGLTTVLAVLWLWITSG